MKQEHRDNLIKLAEYILNDVSDKHFNMENYRSSVRTFTNHRGNQATILDAETFYSFGNCGTVGCALGWAPFALTEAEPSKRAALRKEFFDTFIFIGGKYGGSGYVNFNNLSLEMFGIPVNSLAWEYLFSADWARCEIGGTREAFVERAAVYLSAPEMFRWKRELGDKGLQWVQY